MTETSNFRTANYFTLTIDAEDKERIKEHKWKWREEKLTCETCIDRKTVQLARTFLNYSGKQRIQFKNGDHRDLRKENLQLSAERQIVNDDHMILTSLSTGQTVTVQFSPEDKEWIEQFSWLSHKDNGYVYRSTNKTTIFLHREIFTRLEPTNYNLFDNKEVDHINHVRTDNRRENLRIISRIENNQNKGLVTYNTTGVRYVSRKDNAADHSYFVEYSVPRKSLTEPLKKIRKTFSDAMCGGKEQAFLAAKAYKESLDMEYHGSIQI